MVGERKVLDGDRCLVENSVKLFPRADRPEDVSAPFVQAGVGAGLPVWVIGVYRRSKSKGTTRMDKHGPKI